MKVKAVGAASMSVRSDMDSTEKRKRSQVIEAAMSKAILKCYAEGITDPVKIKEAMLAAREKA